MASSTKKSVADYAEEHEVSARRVRRILRSLDLGIGKGKQYALTAAQQAKVTVALKADTEPEADAS